MAKVAERPQVADEGKIPEVPQQLPLECCPLLTNRFMPVLAAPLRDALERAPKPGPYFANRFGSTSRTRRASVPVSKHSGLASGHPAEPVFRAALMAS
jgi:hypothetical protein